MSFKDTLSWLDQLISRQNDFFYKTLKNYQDQLEPFSGRESQDIYCWLEKFKNQFKSRGRKLDSACLAFSWACNLTGLAKTFYFSLEPETRNIEFIDTTCRRLGVSQVEQFYYFVNGGMQTLNAKFWWVKRKIISQQLI